MYLYKKTLDNIKYYYLKKDTLLYYSTMGLFVNNQKIPYDNITGGSLLNDNYFIANTNNFQIIFDKQFIKKGILDNHTLISDIYFSNNLTRLTSINTKFNTDGSIEYNWVIFDILENKIVKDLHLKDNIFGFHYTYKDTIIYRTDEANTIITAFDFITARPLWQFDLTTLGTYSDYNNEIQNYNVEKILGVHNERLYIGLSDSLILELDITTGDIKYKWHKLPKQFVKHPSDGFSARLFDLDTENNQLICLAGRRYDTIDLDTKTYNSIDITKELEQYDIVSIRHQGDFTNEHISAIAHLKNDTWFQDGIVVFNRKTNKIDWFYKNETFTTGTDTPKLAGNKLYQLDNDRNLYVFEKEKT
jgi:hypothetical protein